MATTSILDKFKIKPSPVKKDSIMIYFPKTEQEIPSILNESINKNKILGFIIQSFQSELKRF